MEKNEVTVMLVTEWLKLPEICRKFSWINFPPDKELFYPIPTELFTEVHHETEKLIFKDSRYSGKIKYTYNFNDAIVIKFGYAEIQANWVCKKCKAEYSTPEFGPVIMSPKSAGILEEIAKFHDRSHNCSLTKIGWAENVGLSLKSLGLNYDGKEE